MSNKNTEKILIIIPTYNESENIISLIEKILSTGIQTEIVVIDDNSPDGTAALVKAFSKKENIDIGLVERMDEKGLGTAYRDGLAFGLRQGFDILITMDADHSHNPSHLPAMLEAIKGNDVVIGSRYIRDGGTINWRIRRILLSWLANKFARFMLGLKGSDLTSGYRVYRAAILEAINLEGVRSNGYSYLVEMLYRVFQNGARVCEVPIIFFDRSMGKSKISKKEIYKGILTLIRLKCGFK